MKSDIFAETAATFGNPKSSQAEDNSYIGLCRINKEELKHFSSFDLYHKVDELAPCFQKGQTSALFLFLYFINILVKADIDFLVKGGIILNMFLGKHARRTKDIDVYVKDPELFFSEVNKAVAGEHDGFIFKTRWIKSRIANQNYYQNTFVFLVEAYHGDDLVESFTVDGVFSDKYDELKRVKYIGPKIVDDDFYFFGVSIEYIASEKILAVTSDLIRSYKHLVDLYSLTKFEMNIPELKEIIFKSLKEENLVRAKHDIPKLDINFHLDEEKEFGDSYFMTVIQAGYRITEGEMIEAINEWFTNNSF